MQYLSFITPNAQCASLNVNIRKSIPLPSDAASAWLAAPRDLFAPLEPFPVVSVWWGWERRGGVG